MQVKLANHGQEGSGVGEIWPLGIEGGLWKRGRWEWLYGRVKRKRGHSQTVA